MNEFPQIQERNGQKAVSARELHQYLESKKDFSSWIKQRIDKYDLVENVDYISFTQKGEREIGGTTRIEYALTIDAAKELSMVEGNAKGKKARKYFIEVEKQATKPLSTLDILELSIKQIRAQEQRVNAIENKVLQLEAKTTTRSNYYAIMGYASLNKIPVGLSLAAKLGAKAKAICKNEEIPIETIPDPRFGRVNIYPYEVLDRVFSEVVQ